MQTNDPSQRGAARRASRPLRDWRLRGAAATLAIALGYLSVTHSLAYAIGKEAPERGHALAPSDGRVAALLSQKLFAKQGAEDRREAVRLAREALGSEPLAVPAIATLAMDADLRGKPEEARRLFSHSDALSRRDLSTRLWLIEDAVRRNDVPAAIRNYDIALRTAPKTFDLLFPLLAGAIDDPAISSVLAATLAKGPLWRDDFIRYLSVSSPAPGRTADFFRLLRAQKIEIGEIDHAGVVNALAAANAFDEAWSYYRSLHPTADRRRSRDPQFAAQLEAPSAFDWSPRMSDTGITASIQRNAKDGVFDFAAPSTIGGIVLEQLQLLPPGRYRITGRSTGIEQPAESSPYWQLVCVDGRELGRVAVPNSGNNEGRFDGIFAVSAPCPAQILRLMVRPSSAVSGVSGQIDHVLLQPL